MDVDIPDAGDADRTEPRIASTVAMPSGLRASGEPATHFARL